MTGKIKTHPELYEESLELEDNISLYKEQNDTNNLEKSLKELIDVYSGLNYCEEDEYLENIVNCYFELAKIYENNSKKLFDCYVRVVEAYDLLIQRDKGLSWLLEKHIAKVNEIYLLCNKLRPQNKILEQFPRLKSYIK